MILIILSLIMGVVGFYIGMLLGAEIFAYFFAIVGVLSPGLFVLDKIYREIKKKAN